MAAAAPVVATAATTVIAFTATGVVKLDVGRNAGAAVAASISAARQVKGEVVQRCRSSARRNGKPERIARSPSRSG